MSCKVQRTNEHTQLELRQVGRVTMDNILPWKRVGGGEREGYTYFSFCLMKISGIEIPENTRE